MEGLAVPLWERRWRMVRRGVSGAHPRPSFTKDTPSPLLLPRLAQLLLPPASSLPAHKTDHTVRFLLFGAWLCASLEGRSWLSHLHFFCLEYSRCPTTVCWVSAWKDAEDREETRCWLHRLYCYHLCMAQKHHHGLLWLDILLGMVTGDPDGPPKEASQPGPPPRAESPGPGVLPLMLVLRFPNVTHWPKLQWGQKRSDIRPIPG